MNFRAFGQQAFAPALAPPREAGPPRFGAHARAKTVLILSGALRALKCSFHDVAAGERLPYGRRPVCQFPLLLLILLMILGAIVAHLKDQE